MKKLEVIFTEYGSVGFHGCVMKSFDIKLEVTNEEYNEFGTSKKSEVIKEFVKNFNLAHKMQREVLKRYRIKEVLTHYIFIKFNGYEQRIVVNVGEGGIKVELQQDCVTMKQFMYETEQQCYNRTGKMMGEILRVYFENGTTDFSNLD